MEIKNLKTKGIGPFLLLIPMACMHLGDGHHSGDHYSSIRQPSDQYPTYQRITSSTTENVVTWQNSMVAQEGTETQPEGEKGG
jgi:hypothetical protein